MNEHRRGKREESREVIATYSARGWRMSRLRRDRTDEPVARDQIFRHVREQGEKYFPCSAEHDWEHYPVDPYSAITNGHKNCTLDNPEHELFAVVEN